MEKQTKENSQEQNRQTFYITTPIYYTNSYLHIGHSYCTIATDTMARYKKLRGYDVKFLTGSDEHGQKIENSAKEKGISPKEYVDHITEHIKDLWKLLNIDYDYYIRTTDDKHISNVQKIFKALYDKGDIYKGYYEGLYCTPCETFFTEGQLVDGKCPDCNRDVHNLKEESYFFKLSKYQDRLIKHIQDNDDFISPASRKNEMLNNFLLSGLEDLCVSRTSFKWGIPVDFDEGHIVYVWIDALSNYISALGYNSEDTSEFEKYWPADVHVVGKEIVRFHTIIWPAMLMALDLELPKQIFGHGWLIIDGAKMSKSVGNVVDPKVLINRYGVDAIRYFLLREVAFGQDGNFTNRVLIERINYDLANDLGNLLSRTVGMIDKYFAGTLPKSNKENNSELFKEIKLFCKETVDKTEKFMDKMQFSNALVEIWNFVRRLNKFIDETSPWVLAKNEDSKDDLINVMYTLAEGLRIIAVLISPAMPNTSVEIFNQLSIEIDELKNWNSLYEFGLIRDEFTINKGDVVFPRIDIDKELEQLESIKPKKEVEKEAEKPKQQLNKETINFEDFTKMDFKMGLILECEKVKKSDKLLKSQVKIGEKVIQVVSGIAEHYTPEEMVGKKVVVLVNLKASKFRGELSEGMILCASDDLGNLKIITSDDTENIIEDGSEVR